MNYVKNVVIEPVDVIGRHEHSKSHLLVVSTWVGDQIESPLEIVLTHSEEMVEWKAKEKYNNYNEVKNTHNLPAHTAAKRILNGRIVIDPFVEARGVYPLIGTGA